MPAVLGPDPGSGTNQSALKSAGVDVVVSITSDAANLIGRKVTDEKLSTPVLSDPTLQVSKAYNANQVLDRLGTVYPLRVTEIDLASAEGQRLASQSGVLFAPGALAEGEPFSFGRLSERKFRRRLDARAGT
jgi:hypothetical protein